MEHSTVQLVFALLTVLVTFSSCLSSKFDCDPSGSCSGSPWRLAFLQETSVHYLTFSENSTVSEIPQDKNHQPVALTTNIRENVIYWADLDVNGLPAIYFSRLNVTYTNIPLLLVDTGIYEPQGLAMDWITNNLYFVDSKASQIIVCPALPHTRCSVVFKEEIGKPCSIAVNPNKGLMFWTNQKYPAIKRAGLDGAAPISLVSTDIQVPKAIAVDDNTVFWTDLRKETIESVNYDGTGRKIVIKEVYTFGIGILDQSIFWACPHGNDYTLQKADKHTGENQTEILEEFLFGVHRINNITDINVMHVSTQPISRNNSCMNKRCSHICVLSGSDDATCMCPEGMAKNANGCSVESVPKIFLAQNTTLLSTEVGAIGTKVFQEVPLPSRIRSIDALVYNPMSESIILYDGIRKKIFNFKHKSNELDLLVEKGLVNIVSMDIDFLSHTLFWLDAGKNQVEMFSLKSGSRLVVYKNFQSGHQVVNDFGTLYVTTTGITGNQEVHSITLERPVNDQLIKTFSPDLPLVQMVCDQATHMLVTISSKRGHLKIQSEHTSDNESTTFILNHEIGSVWGVKKIGNSVFWVDKTNKMKAFTPVESLNGNYLLDRIPINDNRIVNNFKKLIAVFPGSQYVKEFQNNFFLHFCSYDTVFCPHFCVPTKNLETEFVCMCEDDHKVEESHFGGGRTLCVKVDSGGTNATDSNPVLESSTDSIRIASNGDTGKKERGVWFELTLSLSLLLLCGLVGFGVWYWKKSRPAPINVVPYTRNLE